MWTVHPFIRCRGPCLVEAAGDKGLFCSGGTFLLLGRLWGFSLLGLFSTCRLRRTITTVFIFFYFSFLHGFRGKEAVWFLHGLKTGNKSHVSDRYVPKHLSANTRHRHLPSAQDWTAVCNLRQQWCFLRSWDGVSKTIMTISFLDPSENRESGWLHGQGKGSLPRGEFHTRGTTSFSLNLHQAKFLQYWGREGGKKK